MPIDAMHPDNKAQKIEAPLSSVNKAWPLPTSVVSSEISGGKFPEIYSNLSGNFRKFVNYLIPISISCFQVQHCKVML